MIYKVKEWRRLTKKERLLILYGLRALQQKKHIERGA